MAQQISDTQTVNVKVLREFYFKSDDAPRSAKPKKYTVGQSIEMTGAEYRLHASTNRVCLPGEFDEKVRRYKKPEQGKGK